jgi:hypothetical protein
MRARRIGTVSLPLALLEADLGLTVDSRGSGRRRLGEGEDAGCKLLGRRSRRRGWAYGRLGARHRR